MGQIGYDVAEFAGRPIIGIINTWSDFAQCHAHFKHRVDDVKRGVLQAGGFPVELPAISLSESTVKPTTMLYRNFLAMETEELIRSQPRRWRRADGRLRQDHARPHPRRHQRRRARDLRAGRPAAARQLARQDAGLGLGRGNIGDERRAGNISDKDWDEMQTGLNRSYGVCMTMGTASTMTGLADVLGMYLPGTSSIPAPDSSHVRMCSAAGRRAVDMVWEDLTPTRIMTRGAFQNAINVAMAMELLHQRRHPHPRHGPPRRPRHRPPSISMPPAARCR